MAITYVIGDATNPTSVGPKLIVHICNDVGTWGRGFVLAMSRRWAAPEQKYKEWFRGNEKIFEPFELRQVQFVQVEADVWVANLMGQHGVISRTATSNPPPIRYDALRQGLKQIADEAKLLGATIHMPRIGTGLAGGKWEEISKIIDEELVAKRISVTVYDLPEIDTA